MQKAREYLDSLMLSGVCFFASGGRLFWHAPRTLADPDLAQAKALNAELIALVGDPTLEALCDGLPPEDALDLREERAAILEFEAGFSRTEAEVRAGLLLLPREARDNGGGSPYAEYHHPETCSPHR